MSRKRTVQVIVIALGLGFVPTSPTAAKQGDAYSRSQLRSELDKAIASPAARHNVRISTECHLGERREAVSIYGAGIGIWNERAQFLLDDATLTTMLRAFDRHGFLSLAESYGGRRAPQIAGAAQALRVTCTVSLVLPAGEHAVVQLEGGEQSAALKALATEIIQLTQEPARRGVTVANVTEGLTAVSDGGLAPEALRLVAHFKPTTGSGWLLEIRDGEMRSQAFDARGGYSSRKRLVSPREHIRALAQTFAAAGIASLPARLALEDYTELQIQVLDQRSELLARPLAGQPPPPPEARTALLQIREALDQLHRRVLKEGRADP